MKPIITRLAGVTFDYAQEHIEIFGCKDIGSFALVREPDNPNDPNAIRVALGGGIYMGYLPRHVARQLAPEMDSGKKFIAYFLKQNKHPHYKTVGLLVQIEEIKENEAA